MNAVLWVLQIPCAKKAASTSAVPTSATVSPHVSPAWVDAIESRYRFEVRRNNALRRSGLA